MIVDGSSSLALAPDEVGVTPCAEAREDLWFAQTPTAVETAKALCRPCPVRQVCLAGALERGEPWGVWGGELVERGVVVPRKKPRGRPPTRPRDGGPADRAPTFPRDGGSADGALTRSRGGPAAPLPRQREAAQVPAQTPPGRGRVR